MVRISCIRLLECLIDLDWWHELALSQECVYLLDELKRRVLLVQDERVNVVDHDGNLSLGEEQLQLLPVVFLLLIAFCVVKTVHLNFSREVTREHLSHEEAVVESPKSRRKKLD